MSELRKDGTSLELVQPGADELLIVPAKLSYWNLADQGEYSPFKITDSFPTSQVNAVLLTIF